MDVDALNAAVVSETDAAHSHSSSEEEDGYADNNAESTSHGTTRRVRQSAGAAHLNDSTRDGSIDRGSSNNEMTNREMSNHDHMNCDDSDSDENVENSRASNSEELYCENMDDEDEAWVYKHMRGGQEEVVYVRRNQSRHQNNENESDGNEPDSKLTNNSTKLSHDSEGTSSSNGENNNVSGTKTKNNLHEAEDGKSSENIKQNDPIDTKQSDTEIQSYLQKALLLKPRSSDAILSCPRCFNIVCMDCQQHERYANQYRAMFVMNIGVDWQKRMFYDDALGGLKLLSGGSGGDDQAVVRMQMGFDGNDETALGMPNAIPHHDEAKEKNDKEEIYYSVHCSYCQWEVAALDMTDEIYYFFGCIASS